MNPIKRIFTWYSEASRSKRRQIFREYFEIDETTKILDLGSEDGSNIARVIEGSPIVSKNVYVADIESDAVKNVSETYGFTSVVLREGDPLPFEDGFFDIVYCSSVLEHVTIPKSEIWELRSGREFRSRSLVSQEIFANEIKRVGKQYFIQTPCRTFLLESHSWLPIAGMLPREVMVPLFSLTNKVWVKGTVPDFYLLSSNELRSFFPDAEIVRERSFGLTKSFMAIRANK
ncbi:MAG TPA: methyltransferase domain-containing protein [Pyrinomonadaceae bacterium]|nr:methyltransferase domain-containing protein [Pyrinomonadaceae bacterium]